MRFAIGAVLAFLLGAGCRVFAIPAPCPEKLKGGLLVVAVTIGYIVAGMLLKR